MTITGLKMFLTSSRFLASIFCPISSVFWAPGSLSFLFSSSLQFSFGPPLLNFLQRLAIPGGGGFIYCANSRHLAESLDSARGGAPSLNYAISACINKLTSYKFQALYIFKAETRQYCLLYVYIACANGRLTVA